MEPIKLIQPPEYTEDERQSIVDFVLALKKTYIKEFLKRTELPVSGTEKV